MTRALLATAANETDQQVLQSKIIQLSNLQKTILSDANTPDEIDALKRKIDQVTAVKTDEVMATMSNEIPRLETTV
jgi:hypothetical protein